MSDPGMKCTRCRQPADHRFPSHNVHFCDRCLVVFVRRQVERAIDQYDMLEPGQRVLVALSGGKDSLALWWVLRELGYEAEAIHLGLGLGSFSEASLRACQAMAEKIGGRLHHFELGQLTGFAVGEIARANRRQFCSVCGTVKRHYVNRLCLELGFDTLAMGQHLDDEAGRLLGNMIHQRQDFMDKQWPMLEGVAGKFARKVKPLVRLSGQEIGAYAGALGLPVCQERCTKSKGATLTYYQEAMDLLEQRMPGTKRALYFGFLESKDGPPKTVEIDGVCSICGAPSFVELCPCCRLLKKTESRSGPTSDDQGQAHT